MELQDYLESKRVLYVFESELIFSSSPPEEEPLLDRTQITLDRFIKDRRQADPRALLFQFIDQSGLNDADIYKKGGIDRRHFSKIRSNANYRMGKSTMISLAFALELSEIDTRRLLSSAGYSLSESETFDLIIQFFLEKKHYNMDDLNEALDQFNLKPLTGGV
jgi:hypothetical protein